MYLPTTHVAVRGEVVEDLLAHRQQSFDADQRWLEALDVETARAPAARAARCPSTENRSAVMPSESRMSSSVIVGTSRTSVGAAERLHERLVRRGDLVFPATQIEPRGVVRWSDTKNGRNFVRGRYCRVLVRELALRLDRQSGPSELGLEVVGLARRPGSDWRRRRRTRRRGGPGSSRESATPPRARSSGPARTSP